MFPIETELKLRLVYPENLPLLLSHPCLQDLSLDSAPALEHLETTYYDTPDHRLMQDNLSFRLRRNGQDWTATVKADGAADGGLHRREEYNLNYTEPLPTILPFTGTPLGSRLTAAVGEETLQPIFTTNFDRHSLQLSFSDGSQAELALDHGEIAAAGQNVPFAEIELELKKGQLLPLLRLAAELSGAVALLPEADSKWDRGARLAGLTPPKTESPPLNTKKSVLAQDARLILSPLAIAQIHRVILAQQHFLDQPQAPENLHQLRISLRRLRVFLSFCKPLLPTETIEAMLETLRSWSLTTEALRETDVLLEYWQQLTPFLTANSAEVRSALADLLHKNRSLGTEKLVTDFSSGQYTPFILELWRLLEEWPQMPDPAPLLSAYLEQRLGHWLQNMLTAGADLALADRLALHQLRIQAKKLRYVLEIITPFQKSKHTRQLYRRLKRLQEHLGTIHDSLTAPVFLDRLVKPSAARLLHGDRGLIIGWQAAQSATARNEFKKSWQKFQKTAANWTKHYKTIPEGD